VNAMRGEGMSDDTPGAAAAVNGPELRPFAAVLQEQRQGGLHSELSELLAEVVHAVETHGKPGALTVTLQIKPAEMPGAIIVLDDVKAKVPEADKGGSLFYPDDRGNLSRRDPRQPELPLRKVEGGAPGESDDGRQVGS
jgi:hypothetical protein